MTLLLRRENVVFLHIPRTGGQWIKKVVRLIGIENDAWLRASRGHLPQSHQLLGHLVPRYDHNIKSMFTFVRHPIAYYESVWMFCHFVGKEDRFPMSSNGRFSWHPHTQVVDLWAPNFGEWVSRILCEQPGWYSRLVDMYLGPEGGEFCKYIGRTEFIRSDFVSILESVGYELTKKQKRTISQYKQWNQSYDRRIAWVRDAIQLESDLKSKICETEASVINRFYGDNEQKLEFF